MKANWGTYIAIFISLFIAFMLYMVFKTSQHNADLITEDYYAKELEYQEEINSQENSNKLNVQPEIKIIQDQVLLSIPQDSSKNEIVGSISFIRYSNKNADRIIELKTDSNGFQKINISEFALSGNYGVNLKWKAGQNNYHYKSTINIPG